VTGVTLNGTADLSGGSGVTVAVLNNARWHLVVVLPLNLSGLRAEARSPAPSAEIGCHKAGERC
jgi:hypothetical protein